MLIHVQMLALSYARTNKNFIAYLTSWYNNGHRQRGGGGVWARPGFLTWGKQDQE